MFKPNHRKIIIFDTKNKLDTHTCITKWYAQFYWIVQLNRSSLNACTHYGCDCLFHWIIFVLTSRNKLIGATYHTHADYVQITWLYLSLTPFLSTMFLLTNISEIWHGSWSIVYIRKGIVFHRSMYKKRPDSSLITSTTKDLGGEIV